MGHKAKAVVEITRLALNGSSTNEFSFEIRKQIIIHKHNPPSAISIDKELIAYVQTKETWCWPFCCYGGPLFQSLHRMAFLQITWGQWPDHTPWSR